MGGVDFFGAGEVGDGAGDFEDAVVGAGAQVEFGERHAEEAFAIGVERDEGLDVFGAHLRVAADFSFRGETFVLDFARLQDARADLRR